MDIHIDQPDLNIKPPNPKPYLKNIAASMATFYAAGKLRKMMKEANSMPEEEPKQEQPKKLITEYVFYEDAMNVVQDALLSLSNHYMEVERGEDDLLLAKAAYALYIINYVRSNDGTQA